MFELENGSINFDPDRLASLKFNPLLGELFENFSLCKDLDPDSNFYTQSSDCQYYSEGSFNNMLIENQICADLNNNTTDFSLLHLNIRSISKKLDSFSIFLGSLSAKFSVIGITETWLDDSSHTSNISGYNFIHHHRVNRAGGGVGIYLRDHLEFKHRVDLALSCDCVESCVC